MALFLEFLGIFFVTVLVLSIIGSTIDGHKKKNNSKMGKKDGVSNQKNSQEVYNPYKDKGWEQSDKEYKYSNGSQSVSPKKQYKANKKVGIVSCPKCGSTSITTTNKKISVGKGAVGAAVGSMVNPVGTVVGAAVGATHSKKIYNVCMNCGHRWKP